MIKEFLRKYLGIAKKEQQPEAQLAVFENEYPDQNIEKGMKTFETNVWVNAAVTVRAEGFSSVRFFVRDKTSDEAFYSHPVLDLINKPNKWQTKSELLEMTSQHIDLAGDSYWKVEVVGTKPAAIQPLMPWAVSSKVENGMFIGYEIQGIRQIVRPEEMVHFKTVTPLKKLTGLGSVFAASNSIDTDKYADQWNLSFFKNGAKPGTILKHKDGLEKDVKKRLVEAFNNANRGADKSHKTIILDGGLEIEKNQLTHQDMEFPVLQDKNRDKILAAFRVPKILVGHFEGGSLAEAETAIYILAKYVTTPKCVKFCEKVNSILMPYYDKTGNMELAFESPVEEDRDYELAKLNSGMNTWLTINERRQIEGYEEVEGGDTLYQNLGLVPLNQLDDEPVEPAIEPVPKTLAKIQQAKYKSNPVEFKKQYVEKFLKAHGKLENRFEKRLKAAFTNQKKRVMEALKDKKSFNKALIDDIFNSKKEIKLFITLFSPLMLNTLLTNSDSVSRTFGLDVNLTASNSVVQDFIANMAVKFATEVTQTTEKQLKETLAEGVGEGDGEVDLAKRVQDVFKVATDSRAATIARTETTKAANGGAIITYTESGVVNEKEWLPTEDDRTRDWHMDVDNVPLIENFLVDGEELEYPGDGRGSPENIINCRCTVVPVI